MKPFRFRLARLLELREREEAERRAEFDRALAALQTSESECAALERERVGARESLARTDPPLSSLDRRDSVLFEAHLRDLLVAAHARREERRRLEVSALDALRAAVRARRALERLRERQTLEHEREADRREQRENDETARRVWRAGREAGPAESAASPRHPLPGGPFPTSPVT